MRIAITVTVEPRCADGSDRPADAAEVIDALREDIDGLDYESGPIAFTVTETTYDVLT